MLNIFLWLDKNVSTKRGKLLNQLLPIFICMIFYIFFILSSKFFITDLINPGLAEKISLRFSLIDVFVGFFLYFVTAIDYALIIGRMQISNPGSQARVVMNVATVLGCYVGVTFVLFLWGFAKEVFWLITPILIFAGSVMVKLAYEGMDYFQHSNQIPQLFSKITVVFVTILHYLTRVFTFWMPEMGKPDVKPMKVADLAKWSFFLPFLIGLDDLIGYMGAMTIYNAFGLLIGIYFADIFIDILIFVSPRFTKKIVESALLSFIATFAFIFLAYKSFSEALHILTEKFFISGKNIAEDILLFFLTIIVADIVMAKLQKRKAYISHIVDMRK